MSHGYIYLVVQCCDVISAEINVIRPISVPHPPAHIKMHPAPNLGHDTVKFSMSQNCF